MNRPRVGIVIVNWNNASDTINCLSSLDKSLYTDYVRIIVDNGSSDNSIEKILDNRNLLDDKPGYDAIPLKMELVEDPEVSIIADHRADYLIKNSVNAGYTGGNNIGISFCLKNFRPNYILLLNNDTIVDEQMIGGLVKCMDDSEDAIVQPKILFERNRDRINSTGNYLDLIGNAYCRGVNEIDRGQYDNNKNDGFFYASGAAMMVRTSSISSLTPSEDHFFDALLFAYHEDVDISWIARTRGLRISYCPNSVCYHKGRTTTNASSINRIGLIQRNNLRVLIKNHNQPWIIAAVPASVLFNLAISLFLSLAHKKPSILIVYLKGVMWNIRNIKSTLVLRKWVQEGRTISDTVIFQRTSLVVHSIAKSEFGDGSK